MHLFLVKIVFTFLVVLLVEGEIFAQKLLIVSGNNQVVSPGENVSLVVKAVDEKGNPLPGVKIEFSLHSIPFGADDTMISQGEALTNKQGIAFTTLSVGNQTGTYRVIASSKTQSVVFSVRSTEKKALPSVSIPWPQENIIPLPPITEEKEIEIDIEKEKKITTPGAEKYVKDKPGIKDKQADRAKAKEKKEKKVKEKEVKPIVERKEQEEVSQKVEVEKPKEERKATFKLFTVADRPTKIKIKARNNTLVANGEDTTLICAEVLDKYENKVSDGTIVSFSSDMGKIISVDRDPKKDGVQQETSRGVACVNFVAGTVSGVATVVVSSYDAKEYEQIILNPGPVSRLTISPEKLKVMAGEDWNFDVSAYDGFGNLVEVTPVFSVIGNIGEIDKNGKFSAKFAGEGEVVASVLTMKAKASVSVSPGAPDKIVIFSTPKNVAPAESVKIVGRVVDKFNNPVQDVSVRFEVIGGNSSLQSLSDTTDIAGRFTMNVTTSTKVEENQIRITSPGVPPYILRFSTVSSSPSKIVLLSDKSYLMADGKDSMNIEVSAYDKYGNALSDGTVVSFFATGGVLVGEDIDVSSPGLQLITRGGKCKLAFRSGTVARKAQIEARIDELKESMFVELLPNKASKMTIDLDAGKIVANGKDTTGATIVVMDDFGNKVADNTIVNISISDGEIIGEDIAPHIPGMQFGTKEGVVKFRIRSSTKAGSVALKANIDDVSTTKVVNFVAGPLYRLQVIPEDARVVAGESLQFSARGYDIFGNPINVSPSYDTKGVGRINKTTGLFTATRSGEGQVIAMVGDVIGLSSVIVLPSEPVEIKITTAHQEVVVGESIPVTATVYDVYGNPVPGVEVIFRSQTEGAKLSLEKGITDSEGNLTTILTLPTKITDVVIDATSPQIKRKEKKKKD